MKKYFILFNYPFNKINNEIYFLYGHYILREGYDLNVAFELLQNIKKDVVFLDFDEACEIIKYKKKLNCPAVCFSFDDGFDEIVNDVCPIIKDLGANPCVFVNPGFIDGNSLKQAEMCNDQYHVNKKPATWEDLSKFVKTGGVVGSHTVDHLRLSDETFSSSEYQIIESKKIIESKLNVECRYFAWPYGTAADISDESLLIALNHYDLVFSAIRSKNRRHKNERVLNRDHFELSWPYREVKYFLAKQKLDLVTHAHK